METLQEFATGWDRTFFSLSSKCSEPICWVNSAYYRLITPLEPGQFSNSDYKAIEVAKRTLLSAGLILTSPVLVPVCLGLAGVGKILRAMGCAVQQGGFTYLRGNGPIREPQESLRVLSWNICGVAGGGALRYGGVVGWRDRIDELVRQIEREDPDVLILQEVYDVELAEALAKRLNSRYGHFFIHMAPNVRWAMSGLWVAAKIPVERFTFTPYDHVVNGEWVMRGFATLESKKVRVVGTHLQNGASASDVRSHQIQQMVQALATKKIPTILAGDLNLERGSAEDAAHLAPYFEPGYRGEEPTCTNRLIQQWNPNGDQAFETIDYISLFKQGIEGIRLEARLVRAFTEEMKTKTALSDHHGLVSDLTFVKLRSIDRTSNASQDACTSSEIGFPSTLKKVEWEDRSLLLPSDLDREVVPEPANR